LTSGNNNVAIGSSALNAAAGATDSNNVAVGVNALQVLNGSTGTNTAVGANALSSLTTGHANTVLGSGAGSTYTTESNNIAIGNTGTVADAGAIRIGTSGTHTTCFVQGINGVNVPGSVVNVDSTGKLGSTGNAAVTGT